MLLLYYADEQMNCTHLFFHSPSFLHNRISGGIPLGTIPLSISTRLSTTEKTDTGRSPPNNCVTLARCQERKKHYIYIYNNTSVSIIGNNDCINIYIVIIIILITYCHGCVLVQQGRRFKSQHSSIHRTKCSSN